MLDALQEDKIRFITKLAPQKIELITGLQEPIFNIMLNPELTQHQKATKILNNGITHANYINDHLQDHQTQELKTRIKHAYKLNINGVKLELQYSSRKHNHQKPITQYKIKLLDAEYFKHDIRISTDKIIWTGCDIGAPNRKSDYLQEE